MFTVRFTVVSATLTYRNRPYPGEMLKNERDFFTRSSGSISNFHMSKSSPCWRDTNESEEQPYHVQRCYHTGSSDSISIFRILKACNYPQHIRRARNSGSRYIALAANDRQTHLSSRPSLNPNPPACCLHATTSSTWLHKLARTATARISYHPARNHP
jgi:hypothetical protein